MSKNAQRMITGAGFLGGLSLMALVFSIQRDPLAWTSGGATAVSPVTVASPTPTPRPLPTSGPPPADPLASKASPLRVI